VVFRLCRAVECFRKANDIQPNDSTFIQLGKVYTMQDDYSTAIQVHSFAQIP
jgi:Bardet-Biedl syndrome 4 protein